MLPRGFCGSREPRGSLRHARSACRRQARTRQVRPLLKPHALVFLCGVKFGRPKLDLPPALARSSGVSAIVRLRCGPLPTSPEWRLGNGKCWNVANVEMLPIVNWAATSAAPPVAARGTLALPWQRSRGDRPTKRLRFTFRESLAPGRGPSPVSRRTAVANRRSCSACAGEYAAQVGKPYDGKVCVQQIRLFNRHHHV